MKLLIVEDEPEIGKLLAELMLMVDGKNGRIIESVVIAQNLDDALRALWAFRPGDAVICDGSFPTGERLPGSFAAAQDSAFGKPRSNWPHVAGVAEKIGLIFVLYSGDPETVERGASRGMLAYTKPTRAETLYAAIIEARQNWGSQTDEKSNPNTQHLEPSTGSLDDPRFVNGRRSGCLSPNADKEDAA